MTARVLSLFSGGYRICGNGVVAPVAAWIGRRIVERAA